MDGEKEGKKDEKIWKREEGKNMAEEEEKASIIIKWNIKRKKKKDGRPRGKKEREESEGNQGDDGSFSKRWRRKGL